MTTPLSVVTGGTGGIGRAVAAELTGRGHHVLTVGRSAHADIRADLSLLADTDRAATSVRRAADRLDALVLCAGVLSLTAEDTSEGLERTLVLNYLSRFLLIRRLLPMLAPGGRIVLVANAGKYPDTLDLSDLAGQRGRGLRVSGRTQFANDLLAVEFASRLTAQGITVSCVSPGPTRTDVFRNARGVPRWLRPLVINLTDVLSSTPEQAAETPVFLADDPGATSGFYGPRGRRLTIPERALRPERRHDLWAASEQIIETRVAVPLPAGL